MRRNCRLARFTRAEEEGSFISADQIWGMKNKTASE